MEKKTKIMLVIGLGVGAYLLYQKQASANPFTWLPIVKTTPTGPLATGQAPLAATGIAAGLSLIPMLPSAFSSAVGALGNMFSTTEGQFVNQVDGYNMDSSLMQSILGQAIVQQSQFDVNTIQPLWQDVYPTELPAGGGVLLPEFY
jgi:hypothetical protein